MDWVKGQLTRKRPIDSMEMGMCNAWAIHDEETGIRPFFLDLSRDNVLTQWTFDFGKGGEDEWNKQELRLIDGGLWSEKELTIVTKINDGTREDRQFGKENYDS